MQKKLVRHVFSFYLFCLIDFSMYVGNSWDNRKTSTKNPGKFYPIELDYGQV